MRHNHAKLIQKRRNLLSKTKLEHALPKHFARSDQNELST